MIKKGKCTKVKENLQYTHTIICTKVKENLQYTHTIIHTEL